MRHAHLQFFLLDLLLSLHSVLFFLNFMWIVWESDREFSLTNMKIQLLDYGVYLAKLCNSISVAFKEVTLVVTTSIPALSKLQEVPLFAKWKRKFNIPRETEFEHHWINFISSSLHHLLHFTKTAQFNFSRIVNQIGDSGARFGRVFNNIIVAMRHFPPTWTTANVFAEKKRRNDRGGAFVSQWRSTRDRAIISRFH